MNGRSGTAKVDDLVRELPGVSRFDLPCGPEVRHEALAATRRWADDRALSSAAREKLVCLTLAALEHGLRFRPEGVTVRLRWVDVVRVRLDLTWIGCTDTAAPGSDPHDVHESGLIFDGLAEQWGVEAEPSDAGWGQWIVALAD